MFVPNLVPSFTTVPPNVASSHVLSSTSVPVAPLSSLGSALSHRLLSLIHNNVEVGAGVQDAGIDIDLSNNAMLTTTRRGTNHTRLRFYKIYQPFFTFF